MTDYLWCEHCSRSFVDPDPRPTAPMVRCPHCDGSAFDLFPWRYVRAERPDYPAVPVKGGVYPVDLSRARDYYTPAAVLAIIEPQAGSGAWLVNPPYGSGE